MSKHIITISGKLGSGKSTAAKKISKILNFDHFSSGDFLRRVAESRGMSIKDLMIAAESDESIDREIDNLLCEKGKEEDLVIDSRLAFHWIPDSFKVYLDIDPNIAAERMFYDLETNESRQQSEHSQSLEEMKQNMNERYESDIKRYQLLYGIDYTDKKHFDLVLDSGKKENTIDVVVKKIIDAYLQKIGICEKRTPQG